VQGGVEERRMEPERAGLAGRLGKDDLGERLVAPAPHRAQSLEGRAVAEAAGGQIVVASGDADRLGAGRRPCRQVRLGRGGR